jgi:hypothetical protein
MSHAFDTGAAGLRVQYRMTAPVKVIETYAAGRVAVPAEVEGYEFPWGVLVETEGLLWVFDFYLESLRDAFRARDFGIVALQERTFAALELYTECAVRENAVTWEQLSRDALGWKIVPGALGRGAVFSILGYIGAENRLRNWLVGEFLSEILPEVLQAVLDGLEPKA